MFDDPTALTKQWRLVLLWIVETIVATTVSTVTSHIPGLQCVSMLILGNSTVNVCSISYKSQEAAEGRTAHNNVWNGVDRMVSNTCKPRYVFDTFAFIPLQPLLWARPPQWMCHQPPVVHIQTEGMLVVSVVLLLLYVSTICLFVQRVSRGNMDRTVLWTVPARTTGHVTASLAVAAARPDTTDTLVNTVRWIFVIIVRAGSFSSPCDLSRINSWPCISNERAGLCSCGHPMFKKINCTKKWVFLTGSPSLFQSVF